MHASESLHLQESAHGSLHQTQSAAIILRFPQDWIPWRNAKLIHEAIGGPPFHAGATFGSIQQRGPLRMNEIKTNAADAAASLQKC